MEVTVLHLSVSLPHLIFGTFWFSLGLIRRLVAVGGTGVPAEGASVAVGVGQSSWG